jgi:hypothetical protein
LRIRLAVSVASSAQSGLAMAFFTVLMSICRVETNGRL